MKTRFLLLSTVAVGLLMALTPPVKKEKWTTLFDGKSITGWHSYHKDAVVGWNIEEGTLAPDGTGGDLVTNKEYENFDLEFEFKIPKGSNSGVVYKIIDNPDTKSTYMSGPEYQIIDDTGYKTKLKDVQLTGANYDVIPPAQPSPVKPVGEWNKGRIVVNKNHIEHFLNGKSVVAYEYGTDAWKAGVAKSKFANWPYATPHASGKIALQNHSAEEKVWFRNIRIQEL